MRRRSIWKETLRLRAYVAQRAAARDTKTGTANVHVRVHYFTLIISIQNYMNTSIFLVLV